MRLLNSRGEDAKVVVQAKPDRFSWTLTNLPEASYFLLYGCAAASTVKVNGRVLQKSTAVEHGSMLNGWGAEPTGNRLVICIPPYSLEQSEPVAEIEVYINGSKE